MDFSLISEDESLNGTTERNRCEYSSKVWNHGGFFAHLHVEPIDSLFVKEGVTKCKEILAVSRLQVFDKKFKLAKKEAAEIKALVKKLNQKQWDKEIVKHTEILEEVAEDIEKQRNICSAIQVRKEELLQELSEITHKIDSIPAEIIDIEKVTKTINEKHRSRTMLLKSNTDIELQVESAKQALKKCQNLVKSVDYEKLMSILDKAGSLEEKIRDLESKRRTLVRDQDALNKKIKMLHNHEYDPDCVYCSSNKFVKDAEKAKKTLPKVTGDIRDLDSIKAGFEATLDALNVTYNAEAKLSHTDGKY